MQVAERVRKNQVYRFAQECYQQTIGYRQEPPRSWNNIAWQLNADGILTARGKGSAWTAAGVQRVVRKFESKG